MAAEKSNLKSAEEELEKEIRAVFYNGGLNCAETTLRLLIERGSVNADISSQKMMSGFGGGIQKGLVCGAVIAAVAALGIKTGRISPEKSREPSAQAVRAFLESFEARFGGLMCCELTRDYVAKSEEMYDHCVDYVAAAIELTESLPGES